MNISAKGVHFIAGEEGFRSKAYNDLGPNQGDCTIGYGYLLHTGVCTLADNDLTWTIDQAVAQLTVDCQTAVAAVRSAVKVRLGVIPARAQVRFDMLCSLAENIGAGAFSSSSLVRMINTKGAPRDWATVGPYWLEWDHDNGVIVDGLLDRRKLEFAIFRAGKYPAV